MTIVTKPADDVKKSTYLVPNAGGYVPLAAQPNEEAHGQAELPQHVYARLRRRRLMTTLCAVLLLLWLLLTFFIASLLLFRFMHRRPVYYGWCGTKFVDQQNQFGKPEALRQKVQVIVDSDTEVIDVPKFGDHRPAVFIHDFKQNVTAIVDVDNELCFIKPLNRHAIKPPKNLIDLIKKIESGYYEKRATVITDNYRTGEELSPADVRQLLTAGDITDRCRNYRTFTLVRTDAHALERPRIAVSQPRRKRSADACFDAAEMIDEDKVLITRIC